MSSVSPSQVSAAFQKKVQNKIKDLLQQMEEGLKTADPHDFSTYTGWTGPPPTEKHARSTCQTVKDSSPMYRLPSRHRLAVPPAPPGVQRGSPPAEGLGLREEDHEDPERPQSDVPVWRRGAACFGRRGPPQTEQLRRQPRLPVQVCWHGAMGWKDTVPLVYPFVPTTEQTLPYKP